MKKTILATLVMMLLVASIVFGAIQLPGLKLNTEQVIQDKAVAEKTKVEPAAINQESDVLTVAKKLENKDSKLSNGATCVSDNECASGFCQCTCIIEETEEVQQEKKEGETKEEVKKEEIVAPDIKLPLLTAKLTLNLPTVEADQKKEIVKEPLVEEKPVVQEQGLKITIPPATGDIKPLKQETECASGKYNCVCAESKQEQVKKVVEKKEINIQCNSNEDCKSGNCQEKRVGGFLGIGSSLEKRCAEVVLTQAEKVAKKKAAVSARLSTSVVKTLLGQLNPLEKKVNDLEEKAIRKGITSRAELEQKCLGCYVMPSGQDEAVMALRKANVQKRTLVLNNILVQKGVINSAQARKVRDSFTAGGISKKAAPITKKASLLSIFGFVTKIMPTGMFSKIITGNVMADDNKKEGMMIPDDLDGTDMGGDLPGAGSHDSSGSNSGSSGTSGSRQPATGCNHDDVCEPQYQETWHNCMSDCHCGNGVCQESVWNENIQNCAQDCLNAEHCGDQICTVQEQLKDDCPEDCLCGNSICDAGEGGYSGTCQQDCNDVCGNGECSIYESQDGTCPDDCCGNGGCGPTESRDSCPEDCSGPNDGYCDPGEDRYNSIDCVECGDGTCDEMWGEDVDSCAEDCASCGDRVCSDTETKLSCASDCDVCGDEICGKSEDMNNCLDDCGPECGNGICENGENEYCADCRNKSYYINISNSMFDSLRIIESRLCEQGLIDLCPSGEWDNSMAEQAAANEKPDKKIECKTDDDCKQPSISMTRNLVLTCQDGFCLEKARNSP